MWYITTSLFADARIYSVCSELLCKFLFLFFFHFNSVFNGSSLFQVRVLSQNSLYRWMVSSTGKYKGMFQHLNNGVFRFDKMYFFFVPGKILNKTILMSCLSIFFSHTTSFSAGVWWIDSAMRNR